jgi:hypothetical protein
MAVRGRKILRMETSLGFLTIKDVYRIRIKKKNLNKKTSLKLKTNLIGPITNFISVQRNQKYDTKIS